MGLGCKVQSKCFLNLIESVVDPYVISLLILVFGSLRHIISRVMMEPTTKATLAGVPKTTET